MVVGRACLVRGEAGRDKGPCVDALERDTCVGALAMVDTFVVGLFATVVVVVDVVAVVVVVDVVVVVVVVDVKIFAVTSLLSSFLLYNSVKIINQDDLEVS